MAKRKAKTLHSAGYVMIPLPGHPRADASGRVLEHVVVAEIMLGRELAKNERVHHRDHNKQNNDPTNLMVLTNSEHSKLHARTNPSNQRRRIQIYCEECNAPFFAYRYQVITNKPQDKRKYCSLDCRHKSWVRQMLIKRGVQLGRTITAPCVQCGKSVTLCFSRRKKLWTCSLECRRAYLG